MHSLPSRRRLSQPNFFRFKCYRLSPLPLSRPSPSLPAPPPAALSGLLPAARLPLCRRPPVPAHALRHAPPARRQTHPHTPGTVRQADARLGGAVRRQGRRTLSQSANRDSVMSCRLSFLQSREGRPLPPPPLPHLPSASQITTAPSNSQSDGVCGSAQRLDPLKSAFGVQCGIHPLNRSQ